jgi:hypothetical protein
MGSVSSLLLSVWNMGLVHAGVQDGLLQLCAQVLYARAAGRTVCAVACSFCSSVKKHARGSMCALHSRWQQQQQHAGRLAVSCNPAVTSACCCLQAVAWHSCAAGVPASSCCACSVGKWLAL